MIKGNYTVNASGVLARARGLWNCPGHQPRAQAIHTLVETFRMSEDTAVDILEGRLLAEVDDNNLLQVTERFSHQQQVGFAEDGTPFEREY